MFFGFEMLDVNSTYVQPHNTHVISEKEITPIKLTKVTITQSEIAKAIQESVTNQINEKMQNSQADQIIYFDFDSFNLDDAAKKQVQKIEAKKIHIVGCASDVGPKAYNDQLSKKRIDSIKEILNESIQVTYEVKSIRCCKENKKDPKCQRSEIYYR